MKQQNSSQGCCIRCELKPIEFRALCSDCDFQLQTMHYSIEYRLDGKIKYMPEGPSDEFSPQWFVKNGYGNRLTKPWAPKRRPFKEKSAEGPALALSG